VFLALPGEEEEDLAQDLDQEMTIREEEEEEEEIEIIETKIEVEAEAEVKAVQEKIEIGIDILRREEIADRHRNPALDVQVLQRNKVIQKNGEAIPKTAFRNVVRS